MSKEWYETWPALEWFKTSWILEIIQALSKVPGGNHCKNAIIGLFIDIFKDLIQYLGHAFIRDHVMSKFNEFLLPPSLENQLEFSEQELKMYHSCILPVFAQGILAKIEAPADVADKLQELAISYCTTAGNDLPDESNCKGPKIWCHSITMRTRF